MSEAFKFDAAGIPGGEEVKNKLSLHEIMMRLGIVDENTNLDDSVYARVDEVMEAHNIGSDVRGYAEGLVALEYLFNNNPEEKEKVVEIAAELAEYAFSDVTPNLSTEELDVFKASLKLEMETNPNFIDAFHVVVEKRKKFMEGVKEFDLSVDADGFMKPKPAAEAQ